MESFNTFDTSDLSRIKSCLHSGVQFLIGSILLAGLVLVQYLLDWTILTYNPRQARGWTSLMLVLLFCSATQLFCIGILGEYLGRLFDETKRRPPYLVDRLVNLSGPRQGAMRLY